MRAGHDSVSDSVVSSSGGRPAGASVGRRGHEGHLWCSFVVPNLELGTRGRKEWAVPASTKVNAVRRFLIPTPPRTLLKHPPIRWPSNSNCRRHRGRASARSLCWGPFQGTHWLRVLRAHLYDAHLRGLCEGGLLESPAAATKPRNRGPRGCYQPQKIAPTTPGRPRHTR